MTKYRGTGSRSTRDAGAAGEDEGVAMVFLVLLMPLLLMVFALLMERLEHRVHTTTMSEQDVEEFLDKAQPEEVNTFIREGWSRALSMFRGRNRRLGGGPRSWRFTSSRSASKAPARTPSKPAAGSLPDPAPRPAPGPARQHNPQRDGSHPTI